MSWPTIPGFRCGSRETLRYDTSSQILARVVVGEVEFHGTTLRDGETLLLVPGSAHRDERVFDSPTSTGSAATSVPGC